MAYLYSRIFNLKKNRAHKLLFLCSLAIDDNPYGLLLSYRFLIIPATCRHAAHQTYFHKSCHHRCTAKDLRHVYVMHVR